MNEDRKICKEEDNVNMAPCNPKGLPDESFLEEVFNERI